MASRKAALVTGAATGIGAAAVLALARAGYDVAVNYSSSEKAARETAAQAEKLGASTLVIKCDVADEAGVRAMLASVKKTFGRLDVLINNAGTTASWKPKDRRALHTSLDRFHRCGSRDHMRLRIFRRAGGQPRNPHNGGHNRRAK